MPNPRHACAVILTSFLVLSGCSAGATASGGNGSSASSSAASSTLSGATSTSSSGSSTSLTASIATSSSAVPATTSSSGAAGSSGASTATATSSVSALAQTSVTTPQLVAASAGSPSGPSGLAADSVINVSKKDTPGVVQVTNEQVQLGSVNSGQAVPAGVGTGIVIDSQGHILTNDHVVRGAQKLVVSLSSGSKEYSAKLVGADPRTDLAVVQVTGASLTPLPLGDSSKLTVGEWVVAIGNALALQGGPTVTHGVVSALGRTVQEPPIQSGSGQNAQTAAGPYLFDVIQTSAPINPGNSGGPLVNLNGQVVGINTLEAGQAEPGVQAEGIGFAIAINTAKKIADTLIAQGHVTYAYLGVSVTSNTPALAAQYGLPNVPGVAVRSVQAGSPAATAGIASKDVITAIGSQAITDTSNLFGDLESYKPGDKVAVTWVQAQTNKKITKTVTLGTAPQA